VGRKKDTIITGGENVAPVEIETVLESHPAVAEAGVHARADPEWGEAVVATVVLRAEADESELIAWCAARLAPFKVPKAIRPADALPRTRSGKLVRDRL
jgi:O-succinylbenzoic acid--CoA ligase